MVASGPSAANVCLPPDSPVTATSPPLPSPTRGVRFPIQGSLGRTYPTPLSLLYASNKQVVIRPLLAEQEQQKSNFLVYRGHLNPVTACQASPSGAYMCTGDERGSLKIWTLDTAEHLTKYENPSLLTGPIRDVDWDSESKRLAIGGERAEGTKSSDCAKAINWDGVSVGVLAQMTKGRVSSVAFKPTRPFRIAVGGMDENKVSFHQGPPFAKIPPTNNVPHETAHTRGGVPALAFNASGSLLVSVGVDRSVCLYDGKTMQLLHRQEQVHGATIYDVAFDSTGKRLLTCSGDGMCHLMNIEQDAGDASKYSLKIVQSWDVAQYQAGEGTALPKVPVGGVQLGCTFCGDTPVSVGLNGQIAILGDKDGNMNIWTGHSAAIAGMAVAAGSNCFYTGDTNGVLCQWDLKATKPIQRLVPPHGNPDLMYVVHGSTERPAAISGVATVVGGEDCLLYSVGWDDNMYVTRKGVVEKDAVALGAQPRCIASGTKLAVIATVKGLLLVRDGKIIGGDKKMLSIPYEANAVCLAASDDMVYVGGSDCKIYIYKVSGEALEQTHVIEGKHLKPIHSVALSPDGSKLAAGDEKDVCVYDVKDSFATLIGRGRWCFHLQRITCLTWSPDGKILASGGADDSIYLWNVDKKTTRVHYPFAHRGGLTALIFVGERELLSTGVDSVVNRWDISKDVSEKLT